MKLTKLFFLLLALCISTIAFAQKTLPNVAVKSMEGETINVKDFATNGKVTVVSFWATWCSPCIRELNAIAELYPDWIDSYDVEVLAITLDVKQRLAKAKSIAVSNQWEYTILNDSNQELQRAMGFQNPPQTYVIDKNGHIVYEHNGYAPGDEEELEKIIALANKGEASIEKH